MTWPMLGWVVEDALGVDEVDRHLDVGQQVAVDVDGHGDLGRADVAEREVEQGGMVRPLDTASIS